ncbi:hypothetical protein PDE_03965 [Penicillium oxalicum 114-2]|uniref:Uncharacterized protein n=1 Tax=Penicillium oxalicum (strain 114-2 / CGMCC 5302) TaxID=933388 RepID=S7ZFF5_PENO1|nr:hypothetical protein PDE_03965 [Penicillium oxalicum 114-2]
MTGVVQTTPGGQERLGLGSVQRYLLVLRDACPAGLDSLYLSPSLSSLRDWTVGTLEGIIGEELGRSSKRQAHTSGSGFHRSIRRSVAISLQKVEKRKYKISTNDHPDAGDG